MLRSFFLLLLTPATFASDGAQDVLRLDPEGRVSIEPKDAGERPPNVVLFLVDDMSATELGCYGNSEHATPNLDALAASGTRFKTCWATPICTPTRVMLLTGQYPHRTGYYGFLERRFSPLVTSPEYEIGRKRTFADILRGQGYATALAGKWQLTGRGSRLVKDSGFDTYRIWRWKHTLTEEGEPPAPPGEGMGRYWNPGLIEDGRHVRLGDRPYGPDLFVDFLEEFMEENRERPFLAYYPMALIHKPWERTPDPSGKRKRLRASLKTSVQYVDHLVGRVVTKLEELGLREDTVILFTADNATSGDKGAMAEEGVRVPLIASWPGTFAGGVVSDALTDLSDILPTLTELAGADLPRRRPIDGKSLVATLKDPEQPHRDWIYSFFGPLQLVREKDHVLSGDGRLLACDGKREPGLYREVVGEGSEADRAARERLTAVLADLPGPAGRPGLLQPPEGFEKSYRVSDLLDEEEE